MPATRAASARRRSTLFGLIHQTSRQTTTVFGGGRSPSESPIIAVPALLALVAWLDQRRQTDQRGPTPCDPSQPLSPPAPQARPAAAERPVAATPRCRPGTAAPDAQPHR